MSRPVVETSAGVFGKTAILAIRFSGYVLVPLHPGLFWHLCNAIGKCFKSKSYCIIEIGPDSLFKFRLHDAYWNRLLAPAYDYEPSIKSVLKRVREIPFVFLDCGANFGYWSILASGAGLGRKRVISVEALWTTFEALNENSALNAERFTTKLAAVTDRLGIEISVAADHDHASAHVVHSGTGTATVRATTIDDVLREVLTEIPERIFVKLDVEGSEVAALRGAAAALRKDVLLCYEDHGADRTSSVTKFVLEELRFRVFFVDDQGCTQQISRLTDLEKIKTDRKYGYNFFGCRDDSAFFTALNSKFAEL